jgi:hypothetical protein
MIEVINNVGRDNKSNVATSATGQVAVNVLDSSISPLYNVAMLAYTLLFLGHFLV